jgi:phosphoenolpyruvate carboxykinase (ATP)
VWLLNTGWSGGPYGVGSRFKLSYTRAFVNAILDGSLSKAKYTPDEIFGLPIPDAVHDVPVEVLRPRNTWKDRAAYDTQAKKLAKAFRDNDATMNLPDNVRAAGPRA